MINYTKPLKIASQKVKNFSEILEDANKMFTVLRETPLPTVHHSELIGITKPYNFFCVTKRYRFMFRGYGLIANPKMIEIEEPVMIDESCAQFPFRGNKRMKRYNKITIEALAESPTTGMLEPVVLDLIGEAAFITQHNIDHARAIFLYGKQK